MNAARTMLSLAEDYLAERRALGFDLRIPGDQITAFARFVDAADHTEPLTTRITLDWVQGQAKYAKPLSWARRLDVLRPFERYLARLDPATEFPQAAIFGLSHRRLAPHIYSQQEICDLLAAARRLAPHGGLRPATYETIFGLIAATGLRLSEALHLRCGDVDLDQGVLTIRNTKFRKSRHVPVHPTVAAALNRYMAVRARHGATDRDTLLFPSSSGELLPKRTIHGVFQQLRGELGWTALLENYFLPGDLEAHIEAFVEHYNHQRYHESLANVTPADAYFGRAPAIIKLRERIKRQTIEHRRLQHRKFAA